MWITLFGLIKSISKLSPIFAVLLTAERHKITDMNTVIETVQSTEIEVSEAAQLVINLAKAAIEKSPTGVSFVSIRNYTNQYGEVSNQTINLGESYEKAKLRDIELLEKLDITKAEYGFKSSVLMLEKARVELIEAFIKPNENRSKGQTEAYTNICKGIRVHNQTGLLYLYGYRINKTVLQSGTYPTKNSKELTIAKDELRKLLKTGKFVNFSLEVGNTLKMAGDTLEL
jgi:Ni,Fe-hydrogenase maturation factor